jgi:hypothetical protein
MPIVNQSRLTVSRALTVSEKNELLQILRKWDGTTRITFDGWPILPTDVEIDCPAPGIETLRIRAAALIR